MQAGVGEIRLPKFARCTQRRQHAIAHRQRHAAAPDQGHRLTDPVTGICAGKLRILEDGVIAPGLAVVGIRITRSPQGTRAQAHPAEIARQFERTKIRTDLFLAPGNHAAIIAPGDVISRGRNIPATNMPVAVIAEVGRIVVVRTAAAKHRRTFEKTIGVVIRRAIALAVAVMQHRQLRSVARHQRILPVEIEHKHIIRTQTLADVVESAVGVLFEAAEPGGVVLPLVVIARAEQTHTERLVEKQKTTEVGVDRLDADADAVKVIARRNIAQMFINEQLLHADVTVIAIGAERRIDVNCTQFLRGGAVDVEHRHKTELIIGRPEGGVALDQGQTDNAGFDQARLSPAAEGAISAGVRGRLRTHRRRQAARLDHRVGNRRQIEKPVWTELFRQHRQIALEHVRIIGIELIVGQQTKRLHKAPAIAHRQCIALKQRRHRHHALPVEQGHARFKNDPLRSRTPDWRFTCSVGRLCNLGVARSSDTRVKRRRLVGQPLSGQQRSHRHQKGTITPGIQHPAAAAYRQFKAIPIACAAVSSNLHALFKTADHQRIEPRFAIDRNQRHFHLQQKTLDRLRGLGWRRRLREGRSARHKQQAQRQHARDQTR